MSSRAERLMAAWADAWSGGDPEAFTPLCTLDVSYEDPVTAVPLLGPAAIAEHAQQLWGAFPDARLEPTGPVMAGSGHIAAPAKLLATQRGSLGGLPASGRFVIVHGITVASVQDDRLRRVRVFFDRYGAAQQLGLLPSAGTLGEKALLALRGFGVRVTGGGGGDLED